MSAFSDLLKGDFGNIGHDLSADPVGTGIGALGLTALTAGLAAPALFGAEAGVGAGLFGAEAAAEGAGSALAYAPEAAGASTGAFDFLNPTSAMGWGDAVGGSGTSALSGLTSEGIQAESLSPLADLGAESVSPIASGTSLPNGSGSAAAEGGGSFIDKLLGGAKSVAGAAGNQFMKNPLGVGAAALGAGLNFRNSGAVSPNQQQLAGQAGLLDAQGKQLTAVGQAYTQYLQNGTLPPGMQAAVDKATAAHKAMLISNAAKSGLNTDPTQNSALAESLAAADQEALIAVAQGGEALFKAGMSEISAGTGAEEASAQIYSRLIQLDNEKSQRMGNAIMNFARSLNGGLTLGGQRQNG